MAGGETPKKDENKAKIKPIEKRKMDAVGVTKEIEEVRKNNKEFEQIFKELELRGIKEYQKNNITYRIIWRHDGSEKEISIVKKDSHWNKLSEIKLLKNYDTYHVNISKWSDNLIIWTYEHIKSHFSGNDEEYSQYSTLKPNEVMPYIEAIKARIKDMKETSKNRFIELSVNEDKEDADNLIETIKEQTA